MLLVSIRTQKATKVKPVVKVLMQKDIILKLLVRILMLKISQQLLEIIHMQKA